MHIIHLLLILQGNEFFYNNYYKSSDFFHRHCWPEYIIFLLLCRIKKSRRFIYFQYQSAKTKSKIQTENKIIN